MIGFSFVLADFKNLRDKADAWPSVDLDDNVQRVGDAALNGAIRNLDAALQDTTGKASQPLLRGTCMDRTERSGVPRVQKLKEIERLAASNFSEQNTIGPMPQRGFKKVANGDSGDSILLPAGFKPNEIRLSKLYLRGVFD